MADILGRGGTEFRIGRVISQSFTVCRRNIVLFTLVCVVAGLPTYLPRLFLGAAVKPSPQDAIGMLPFTLVGLFFTLFGYAIIQIAALQDMNGQKLDLNAAIQQSLARFFPLLGCTLCAGLAVVGGMILLFVPGIIALLMLLVAGQVCLVERLGPIASLSRSAALTKGHRWALLGVILVVGLIGGAFQGISSVSLLHFGLPGVIVALLLTAVAQAFTNTAYAVQYHELRVAKEGVGSERFAAVFD